MSQYIPNGSFTQTARNVRSTLFATAQKRDQSWLPAGLDLTDLNGADIANLDAVLVNEDNGGNTQSFVPSGSYVQTSESIRVILTAQCQKRDQSWQYSSLDITDLDFGATVSNIDGVLTVD